MNIHDKYRTADEALAKDAGLQELVDLWCEAFGPGQAQPDPTRRRVRLTDRDYRPKSYWTPANLRQMVANLRGATRKERALRLIDEGRLDEAGEIIFKDALSESERQAQGQIHPALMGGEYLPADLPGEVEIARITLASVTQDVISLRARPDAGRIRYRVVDEYNSHTTISPESSTQPLSLGEVIGLIDTATSEELGPIGIGLLDQQWETGSVAGEELAGFLRVSSEFYDELAEHYWFAVQRWLARHRGKRRGQ